MPTAVASSYSTQNVPPGHVLPGDERPNSSLGIARPCSVDPVPISFNRITDDASVDSRPLGIDFSPNLGFHPSSIAHLSQSNLERGRERQALDSARLVAPEDFLLRQDNPPYPPTFNPGFPLLRGNPAVYAWEVPEPYSFSGDPDIHSLQHPLGDFDDIYHSGSYSIPDCNTGRPKSFTYGTTYY